MLEFQYKSITFIVSLDESKPISLLYVDKNNEKNFFDSFLMDSLTIIIQNFELFNIFFD